MMSKDATYNTDALSHAKHKKMVKLLSEVNELRMPNPSLALKKAQQALEIAIALKDYAHQIKATRLYGMCQNQADAGEAVITIHKALSLARQYQPNNTRELAAINSGLGVAYCIGGNHQLGIHHLLRALSFDDCENPHIVYSNLGNVYFRVGNLEKALETWQNALLRAQEQGVQESRFELNTLYNIALANLKKEEVEKSKQIALDIIKSLQDLEKQQQSFYKLKVCVHNLLGEIYAVENNFDLALANLNEAAEMAKEQSFQSSICEVLTDKAKLYLKYDKELEAIASFQEALDCATKHDIKGQRQKILGYLSDHYQSQNQLAKAFPYLSQLHQLLQEQFKESRDKNLQKIVTEREKEIQLLEEKNKEIAEHNTILEQFAYIISHDLREPVRGITGFTNLLEKKYGKLLDERGKEYIHFILSETSSINNNLARLLEYTTFKKPQTDEIERIYIPEIINQEQEKHTRLPCKLNINCDDIHLKITSHHARTLFHELIKNAIQFRKKDEDCSVEIYSEFIDGIECIAIKDYGIGIEEQYQKKVFRIFNQLNKLESKGAGVGLAICERIISLYKGKIWIESIPNEFTILHLSIPA